MQIVFATQVTDDDAEAIRNVTGYVERLVFVALTSDARDKLRPLNLPAVIDWSDGSKSQPDDWNQVFWRDAYDCCK